MTARIVYQESRMPLTPFAFSTALPRYGDNERTSAEHGQLWSRIAEGKRRDG